MPGPHRLDDAGVAALRAMAADGWTLARMARRLGVSRRAVEREAVAHGVAPPRAFVPNTHGSRVAAGRGPRPGRMSAVAAMLGDPDLCERVRQMRAGERRSYDYIGGRLDVNADHLRLLGDALGLPGGHLNRGRTPGHAAGAAGAAPVSP